MLSNKNSRMKVREEIRLPMLKLADAPRVKRWPDPDYEKIRRDCDKVKPLLDFSADPRRSLHLDTTKVAFHQERVEAWRRGEKVAPITIDMALTQKCAFACVYCYADLQYNPSTVAEWQVYENFLDDCTTIGHKPGHGVRGISLISDGESTESPYFYDFILKGKKNGIDMAVATNGLRLIKDDSAGGRFPELLTSLTYLRFNISAGEPASFAKVMGVNESAYYKVLDVIRECVRIKKERNLSVTIGLQMVLMPHFADQIIPLAVLGRELGVDYTVIKHCSDDESGSLGVDYDWYRSQPAIDLLKTAEALSTDTYSVQAKWSKLMTGRDRKYSKCFGTPLLLQISGTCLVAPCGMLFNQDYAQQYHIGNFAKDRFRDIWAGDRYWKVIGFLGSDKFDPRKMCGTLCIQDKVNEALFDLAENGIDLPDVSARPTPPHVNFI